MRLGDLVMELQNDLEDLRQSDVLVALNNFIREHPVEKAIRFQLVDLEGYDELLPHKNGTSEEEPVVILNPGDNLLEIVEGEERGGSFGYFDPVYLIYCNYARGVHGSVFTLDQSIYTVKQLYYNGKEVRLVQHQMPVGNYRLYGLVRENRVIELNFFIDSEDDDLQGLADVFMPCLPYESNESISVPYPDSYLSVILDYIYHRLYKMRRYFNADMSVHFQKEYERKLAMTQQGVSMYRVGLVKL